MVPQEPYDSLRFDRLVVKVVSDLVTREPKAKSEGRPDGMITRERTDLVTIPGSARKSQKEGQMDSLPGNARKDRGRKQRHIEGSLWKYGG